MYYAHAQKFIRSWIVKSKKGKKFKTVSELHQNNSKQYYQILSSFFLELSHQISDRANL
jgi:hypothetical protein